MTFLNLPDELIEHIILQLPPSQMALSRSICKLFQSIVDCSAEILLQIELFIQGLLLIDTPGRREAAKKLLQDIKFQQDRYLKIFPTRTFAVNPPDNWEIYTLCEGILCTITTNNCFHFLEVTQDPSKTPWTHDINLETYDLITFWEFTFSVSLDLFVFVENSTPLWKVHLRSLRNNSPHPLATRAFIEIYFEDFNQYCEVEAMGDKLCVMFHEEGSAAILQVFDWKTGATLDNVTPVASFTFLDRNPIATSSGMEEYCLIYLSDLGHIYLELPLPVDMRISQPSRCRSRNVSYLQNQNWCQDPDVEVFVVSIETSLDDCSELSFTLIISKVKLVQAITIHLSILERGVTSTARSERTIPWNDWGPDCTRWIPGSISSGLDTPPVSGSCVVLMAPPSISYSSQLPLNIAQQMGHLSTNRLQILDFNPRTIHRLEEPQSEAFSIQLVTEPWTYQSSGFFFDITCRLPFRVITPNTDIPTIDIMNGDSMVQDNFQEKALNVMTFGAF